MDIEGAGAIVSGGASGLGAATARTLHGAGADVTIIDLDAEHGVALAGELGERARYVRADVRDPDDVAAAIESAGREAPLRVAVSCAGVAIAARTIDRDGVPHALSDFAGVVLVNLIGTFNVMRLAAQAMARAEALADGERGVIVNTASIAAFEGQVGQIAYAASKGGVVGMTLPAARDLAGVGIRVCTIAPGIFDTPIMSVVPPAAREALGSSVPFPSRLGNPGEFADLVRHICENRMLNGETIRLDGALRMPPR